MADKFLTPEFRAAFISVFKATSQKQKDGTQGSAKYGIRAMFPPDTDLSFLKAQARAAAEEMWGSNIPKTLRSPFRKNEELDNPVKGLGDDWIVITFNSPGDKPRPGLVDAANQDIINEADVYSGAWYRVQCRAFGYEQSGNKGVSFGLENVQKLRDDEPLGGGRMPANKAFAAVGDPKKAISKDDDIFAV